MNAIQYMFRFLHNQLQYMEERKYTGIKDLLIQIATYFDALQFDDSYVGRSIPVENKYREI